MKILNKEQLFALSNEELDSLKGKLVKVTTNDDKIFPFRIVQYFSSTVPDIYCGFIVNGKTLSFNSIKNIEIM